MSFFNNVLPNLTEPQARELLRRWASASSAHMIAYKEEVGSDDTSSEDFDGVAALSALVNNYPELYERLTSSNTRNLQ